MSNPTDNPTSPDGGDPFATLYEFILLESQRLSDLDIEDATEKLKASLTLIESLINIYERRLKASEQRRNAGSDDIVGDFDHSYVIENTEAVGDEPAHDDSHESNRISFRGKEMGNQLSYCILSYFELKKGQPIGLHRVSEAVRSVFGGTNKPSLNTKMNRWRDDGVLQWRHSDRRSITPKGVQLRADFAAMIDPKEKARIDLILEGL